MDKKMTEYSVLSLTKEMSWTVQSYILENNVRLECKKKAKNKASHCRNNIKIQRQKHVERDNIDTTNTPMHQWNDAVMQVLSTCKQNATLANNRPERYEWYA